MTFKEFLSKVYSGIPQFAATITVVGGALVWSYNWTAEAADIKARAYIRLVVDDQFTAQNAKIDKLTASINRLVQGQAVETIQSEEEAKIARQILCLQELALDPSRGSPEDCQEN